MKSIYYDCEFIEGTQSKKIFGMSVGKTKPTIEIISIGMVNQDNKEYYAISKDFNLKEAWNRFDIKKHFIGSKIYEEKIYWIRENVLKPIWRELIIESEEEWVAYSSKQEYQEFLKELNSGECDYKFTYKSLKSLIEKFGKSNKEIAEQIEEFVYGFATKGYPKENTVKIAPKNIELYGYYSAYDHVALCWLFGKMIDIPSGFPMYTIDLKQIMDEKAEQLTQPGEPTSENYKTISKKENIEILKSHQLYPKQENEHNSLADAKWNKNLHEFLKNI